MRSRMSVLACLVASASLIGAVTAGDAGASKPTPSDSGDCDVQFQPVTYGSGTITFTGTIICRHKSGFVAAHHGFTLQAKGAKTVAKSVDCYAPSDKAYIKRCRGSITAKDPAGKQDWILNDQACISGVFAASCAPLGDQAWTTYDTH